MYPSPRIPSVPGALQELPFALDVGVLVGHVGLRVVEQEAQQVVRLLPGLEVLADEPLAGLDHLLLAYLLEVLPLVPREPELLLGLELDREPLAVPAGPEDHVLLDEEGAVAVPEVLHYPAAYVPDVGHAVQGRRALPRSPLGASCPCAFETTLMKSGILGELPDLRLDHLPVVDRREPRLL